VHGAYLVGADGPRSTVRQQLGIRHGGEAAIARDFMGGRMVAVHLLAPFTTWATFANLLTPLALVAMFVGEYLLRYRLHPEFERASLNDMIRAYSQARRAVPSAPPAVRPLP